MKAALPMRFSRRRERQGWPRFYLGQPILDGRPCKAWAASRLIKIKGYIGGARICFGDGRHRSADAGFLCAAERMRQSGNVPQSSGSHSVAADSKRNLIFVPQVAPVATVGSGGDTTTVGAGICGTNNGCVAVFQHAVKGKDVASQDE